MFNLNRVSAERDAVTANGNDDQADNVLFWVLSERVPCYDPGHTLPVPVVALSEPRKVRHIVRGTWDGAPCPWRVPTTTRLNERRSSSPVVISVVISNIVNALLRLPLRTAGGRELLKWALSLGALRTRYWHSSYVPFSLPDKSLEP